MEGPPEEEKKRIERKTCLRCGKILCSEQSLKKHMSKKVPCNFECSTCSMKFKNRNTYDYHKRQRCIDVDLSCVEDPDSEIYKKLQVPEITNPCSVPNNVKMSVKRVINEYKQTIEEFDIEFDANKYSKEAALEQAGLMMLCLGNKNTNYESLGLDAIERTCVNMNVPSNTVFQLKDINTEEYDTDIRQKGNWKTMPYEEAHPILEMLSKELLKRHMIKGYNKLAPMIWVRSRNTNKCFVFEGCNNKRIIIYYGYAIDKNGKFDKSKKVGGMDVRAIYQTPIDVLKELPQDAENSEGFTYIKKIIAERKDAVLNIIQELIISDENMQGFLVQNAESCYTNRDIIDTEKLCETNRIEIIQEPDYPIATTTVVKSIPLVQKRDIELPKSDSVEKKQRLCLPDFGFDPTLPPSNAPRRKLYPNEEEARSYYSKPFGKHNLDRELMDQYYENMKKYLAYFAATEEIK